MVAIPGPFAQNLLRKCQRWYRYLNGMLAGDAK